MASSYNRQINLYINGQQVSNDVRSIRAEMTKLVNEQARMTIGSQEYIAHARRIRDLRGILAEHNRQIAATSRSWSLASLGDSFNRYFSMVTAAAATVTGLVLAFKALVKTFNDYEERVDNLSALTGLAGTKLEWLSSKAKELSTSTLETGIRVTQTAQEIVDAFTKTGSARPELLKNKEALSQVTQEAIILSNASKTTLQPAIEALTMVMNQYNVPATEARRIINALGAGSKEGAGEIPYLTTAFEKAGTVAANAGLSIETMVATIETLAPRISQPEIAGRSLKGVLLDLQQGADDTNPAIVGMGTALENLGKKNLDITELTKMFGKENITTAKILLNNVEEFRKYEKAVTGTNVAIEQAAINTDNNNSKLAQARNRINIVSLELGEKLSPAMRAVTGYFGMFLRFTLSLVDIFTKYGRTIVTATAAIIGYALAVKFQAMWIGRANQATLGQIIAQKAHVVITTAETIVTQLWAAAVMLLTGNLRGANQALRVLTNTMKLNPIGLLTTALIAGASALQYYTQKKKLATEAANASNKVLEEEKSLMKGYSAEIVKERESLNSIVASILRTNETEEMRSVLIRKLKDQYPAFLSFINDEKISNEQLSLRLAEVNVQYGERMRLSALKAKSEAITNASVKAEERKLEIEDRLVQIEKERYRVGNKKSDEEIVSLNIEYKQLNSTLTTYAEKQFDITKASASLDTQIKSFDTLPYVESQLSGFTTARNNYSASLKKANETDNKADIEYYQTQVDLADKQIKLFGDKREALLASAKQNKPGAKQGAAVLEDDSENGKTNDLVKLKERELESVRALSAATLAEVAARNKKVETLQKEITILNELGTDKKDSTDDKSQSKDLKKRLEAVEAANKSEIDRINQKHLASNSSEAQYNNELLAQEMAFMQAKLSLYDKGSKEYETINAQLSDKIISESQRVKDLLLEAEQTLADAKIENLKDGIAKEKAIEEQRWKEELDGLKRQLVNKAALTGDEVKLNQAVNDTIAEKSKTHTKVISDLNLAGQLQIQMDNALIASANARTDEETWAAQKQTAQVKYEEELAAADGNAVGIAQAERNLSDTLIRIKTEEMDKRQQIGDAILNTAGDAFAAMSELVGRETALGKVFFLMQQAAAIAQVVFNTAIANSKAVAISPITGGMPWVAINTASAAVSIAGIVAQTISSFSSGSKKKKGFILGGFTGEGEADEPAGIVHKGEYVISGEGVRNNRLKPFIEIIEKARVSKNLARLDLNPFVTRSIPPRGYLSGGYTSTPTALTPLFSETHSNGSASRSGSVPSTIQAAPPAAAFRDPELVAAIKRLNKNLEKGIGVNKYGTSGLLESMKEITGFNSKIGR